MSTHSAIIGFFFGGAIAVTSHSALAGPLSPAPAEHVRYEVEMLRFVRERNPSYNPFPNGVKPRARACIRGWKKLWLSRGSFYYSVASNGRACGWSRTSKAKAIANCEKRTRSKTRGCAQNAKYIK